MYLHIGMFRVYFLSRATPGTSASIYIKVPYKKHSKYNLHNCLFIPSGTTKGTVKVIFILRLFLKME
jgi:hypothetical protein